MTPEQLLRRLRSEGPKRILALDGGGVRGMISLAVLARIEAQLRDRHGRPDLRLSDYFDLIGGTSTGSIIAACLALGMEVSEVTELYRVQGQRVFARRRLRFWQALYDERPLETLLEEALGDTTLGGDELRTGLAIVTKRADTNSTWPLLNHPGGTFYAANRDIRVRDAVRASAAAPVLFRPAQIDVGGGVKGAFVDGAVSMANNPALLLFLLATLRGYPFRWATGADRLLLVSVGAGRFPLEGDPIAMAKGSALQWLAHLPQMLIQDGMALSETILQGIARTPTRRVIDLEAGDLEGDSLLGQPALDYLRYDALLTADGLRALHVPDLVPHERALHSLAGTRWMADLERIGRAAADRDVDPRHFLPAYDLGPDPARRA